MVARDAGELRVVLVTLKPGTTMKIGPGEFTGGRAVRDVAQVSVEALDAMDPPHLKGSRGGLHFSQSEDLTVQRRGA